VTGPRPRGVEGLPSAPPGPRCDILQVGHLCPKMCGTARTCAPENVDLVGKLQRYVHVCVCEIEKLSCRREAESVGVLSLRGAGGVGEAAGC